MNTHIGQTLNARRTRREENEKGFTLIELLVVVLIIGILSAIAIPIFLGQQNQAKDAAAKSDLTNAKIAVISSATANSGTYPAASSDASLALAPYGYVRSDGTGVIQIISAGSTAMCLEVISSTTTPFYITHDKGVSTTACTA